MEALGWVLVVLLCCGSAVGWQMYRYPGGWAYAFGTMYAPDRKELATARLAVRTVKREHGGELSSAEGQLRDAERRQSRRINRADRELKELRNSGPRQLRETMGPLTLYQKSLLISKEEIPLDGLRVRFEAGRRNTCYIHVTLPDGHEQSASFPGAQFEEEDVRGFSRRITNAVADENRACAVRDQRIAEVEEDRRRAVADTAAQEAAREELARVKERHRKEGRLAAAQDGLDRALDQWQDITGHRPAR
ncbi:hypothetical protein [Streptacidiphilus sp. EB103A]|uniref:hypothetical protein n=1 Tax=Streptacidiphilus sp. EB103A TaxID=3156275 RepID=UPI00351806AE